MIDKGEGLDGEFAGFRGEGGMEGSFFKIGNGGGGPETPGELGKLIGPFVRGTGFHGFLDGEPDFGFLIGGTEADGFDGVFVGVIHLGRELGEDVFCFRSGEIAEGEGDVTEDRGVWVIGKFFRMGNNVVSGTTESSIGCELNLNVGNI